MDEESKLNLNAGDYAISHCDSDKTYNGLEVHKMLCDAYIAGNNDTLEDDDERIKNSLINLIKMSNEVGGLALHKWEADEMLAWLEKQGQVKESFISQHENKMCKGNGNSLTCEDEKVRREIINYFQCQSEEGPTRKEIHNKWIAWLERQGEHANFRNKIQVGDKVTRNEAGVLVNLSQLNRVAKPEENKGNVGGISANWSEEDERLCQCLIEDQEEFLDRVSNDKYGHSEIISDLKEMYHERIDWLKSLRPRSTWKPSDEQIKVCKEVYADILSAKGFDLGTVVSELNRLEEELKKLKEE